MSTTVTYKGNTIATVNNNTKTLKTAGKYMEDDVTLVDVSQNQAIVITDELDEHGGTIRHITGIVVSGTKEITSNGTNIDVTEYAAVDVNVPTGGTPRTSSDLTVSGATVTAPAGTYASDASATVASGTVTAPASISGSSATVSTGTNTLTLTKTVSVTPSVTTAGYVSSGTAGNSSVSLTSSVNTRSSSDLTASGATVTAPAGYYGEAATKSVDTMTLPTTSSSSATSGYALKATFDRSTSDRYVNIPPGYNSAGGYYKISKVSNGSATAPASISGSSATVSTGTNTLTLSKTVSVTPSVTAGYVSSGTAGNSSVSLTASVTTKVAATYHPSTSDQTISASQYLTGAQTIKAVTLSNLTAENIKKDVVVKIGDSSDDDCVTSITGSYTGGGGSVSVDTKTVTTSNYPVSIQFTAMKGQPKYFFLRSTSQISSSGNTTYYYIIDMRYDGTNTTGNCFRIGGTRRVDNITSGYSWSYSGTTLTITSNAASRSASPGAFNNTYELVYIY